MSTRYLLTAVVAAVLVVVPAAAQSYAVKDARLVTVSGPVIEKGTVVITDGRIAAVGERVSIPRGTRVIDGKGLTVYPGLFDANTQMGLTEIGQVPPSQDTTEIGTYTPHLMAFSAVHVESEHIPVARFTGVTHVMARPSGGTLPGQGAIVSLAGWNPEEMEISRHGAMILSFPSQLRGGGRRGFRRGGGQSRSWTEQKREYDRQVRELSGLLANARAYAAAKEAGDYTWDKELDALAPVVKGDMTTVIETSSHVDIKAAVEFAEKENLNYVLLGASDAWRVADFLAEHGTRVILGPIHSLPRNEDYPIDIVARTPQILHQAGVKFAFGTGGSSNVRTLPFEVGNAIAYGLSKEEAIRSITLNPAEFLGVADQVGSIEVGKKGNLAVVAGDIFDYSGEVKHLFINGQPVNLNDNKHTRLYEKYISRP